MGDHTFLGLSGVSVQDAEKVHWVRFHIVRNGGHSVHSDQGVLKIPLISLEANN
jgi:hypothetical protein